MRRATPRAATAGRGPTAPTAPHPARQAADTSFPAFVGLTFGLSIPFWAIGALTGGMVGVLPVSLGWRGASSSRRRSVSCPPPSR